METRHPRELFTTRLEAGEDLWLRALGNKLDKAGALEVVEEAAKLAELDIEKVRMLAV